MNLLRYPLSRVVLAANIRVFLVLVLASVIGVGRLQAQSSLTYDWIHTGGSGDWETGANWNPLGPPSYDVVVADRDVVNLTNGVIGAEEETIYGWTSTTLSRLVSIHIGQYNMLTFDTPDVSDQIRTDTFFQNEGSVRATNTSSWVNIAPSGTSLTNTGVIEAAGSGGSFFINMAGVSSIDNEGGEFVVRAGSTLRLRTLNGLAQSRAVTDGVINVDSGGTFLVSGLEIESNFNLALAGDLVVNNHGTYQNDQQFSGFVNGVRPNGTKMWDTTQLLNATDGSVIVRNSVAGTWTGTTTQLDSVFTLADTSSFVNAGLLQIDNVATRTGESGKTMGSHFSVEANANFSNTGTVKVSNESTEIGTSATFSSAKSIVNEGTVIISGNTNAEGALFEVTGGGNSYSQSGSGLRTVLAQGGVLSAATISVLSGELGGAGTVTGNTTIGSAAVLKPGVTEAGLLEDGVLNFSGNLTFADNSEVQFSLGADTAESGQIVLDLTSNLTVGSAVGISIFDNGMVQGQTYRLFQLDTGTITGDFVLNALPSGFQGILLGGNGTNYIDLQLIPEPSTVGLLLLGGALALVCRRRMADRI